MISTGLKGSKVIGRVRIVEDISPLDQSIKLYIVCKICNNQTNDEVIEYLKRELEPLERKGEYVPNTTGQEDYYWGVVCQIHKYSGPDIYIDQITSQVMAEHYTKYLHDKIREWRAKGNPQVN